jgi:hypothetical protein
MAASENQEFGNEKSPGAKQPRLQKLFEVFRATKVLSGKQPELFSWLFYVAASRLNSPRLSSQLIRRERGACQLWVF